MKNIFNEDKNSKDETDKGEINIGNFGDMMKMREKKLPEIEDTIRKALKNYSGQNISIVIINEDENGMPEGCTLVMAGVGRMESQVSMAKSLRKASDKALESLVNSASGDVDAMLAVASAMIDSIDTKRRKK